MKGSCCIWRSGTSFTKSLSAQREGEGGSPRWLLPPAALRARGRAPPGACQAEALAPPAVRLIYHHSSVIIQAAAEIPCPWALAVLLEMQASIVNERTHRHLKDRQGGPGRRKRSTQRWEVRIQAPTPFLPPHPRGKNINKGKSDLLSVRGGKKVI